MHARHHSSMLNRAFLALAIVLVSVGAARADDVVAAREHYARGRTYYDLGRFLDAAHEFEAAYEAKNEPNTLFNIGQSYRFVPDYNKAILAFKAFLRHLPDAPNRAEVEARILELQQLQQAQPRATTSPPAPSPRSATEPARELAPASPKPPSASRGKPLVIAGIAVAAAGVALVAVGGVFVAQTRAADDAVNRPKPGAVFSSGMVDTLNRDQALEATFFAVGGAAVVAGTAVAILGARRLRYERKVALVPVVGVGSGGVVLAGAW